MKDKMKLIVELFNADLDHIIREIATAKYVGASWILIPPQQEHLNYDNEWWSAYKPLGYKITDETREKLQTLVRLCTSQGINVMVDTVLNHTDPNTYKEGHALFHPFNLTEKVVTRQWIFGLPDWNSLHPTVQENGRKLIQTYRELGIRGLRFDAAPFINHEFFDYILQDSPEDELHLYEVFGFDLKYVTQFLKRRLKVRPNNTLLYDFQEYTNANKVINQGTVDESFYHDTILPQYGVALITNHDQILHNWNIKPLDMLTAGVLTTFMSCHDYLLTVVCVTSTIPACSIWSWETVERYFLPVINLKNKYGTSPSVIRTDEEGNILVAVNKNNMFFCFNRNYTSDIAKIPVNYASKNFLGFNDNDILINVFDGKIIKGKHIPVPERNIVVGYNESVISGHTNNLIHMFWYQGWDKVPEYCNKAVNLWKELGQVMLWDRESLDGLMLSEKENKILKMVEERFPVPEMYAAYADIARLIILSKYGGIYVDTDAYPNATTPILFEWLNNNNALIFGKEPSGLVNNAVIITPVDSMHTVKKILDRIIDEIFEKWDDNILNFAGPQRIKTVLYEEKWTDYVILPISWLYATLSATRNGVGENCTDELVLVQHCYAGSWVSDWNSKYINYKPYSKNTFTITKRIDWTFIIIVGLLVVVLLLLKRTRK